MRSCPVCYQDLTKISARSWHAVLLKSWQGLAWQDLMRSCQDFSVEYQDLAKIDV